MRRAKVFVGVGGVLGIIDMAAHCNWYRGDLAGKGEKRDSKQLCRRGHVCNSQSGHIGRNQLRL